MTPPEDSSSLDLRIDFARLEGKIDVVLGKHETRLDAVEDWKVDAEQRLRALEARRFVAPLQLWTVTSGGAAVLLAAATFLARYASS